MKIFYIVSQWFWVVCIFFTFLNAAVYKFRARKKIEQNPDLEEGYNKIIKGYVVWGNLPWIVMGIGCIIGGVPSVWHYFKPNEGNPYVLSFFASAVLIWLLGSYWIFFRDGARELVEHPGMFNFDIRSTALVKQIWTATILVGIIAVVIMFTQDLPIPNTMAFH